MHLSHSTLEISFHKVCMALCISPAVVMFSRIVATLQAYTRNFFSRAEEYSIAYAYAFCITDLFQDDSKESDTFREQLKSRSEEFVTLILENHFGQLIKWSKEAERKLDAGDLEGLKSEEKRVSIIITEFNRDWKKSLDSINSEILSSFPNLKLGTSLLQQCLTSLVQYYHRQS